MKTTSIARKLFLFSSALLMTTFTMAQNPRVSPAATATGTINGANITINYSSPSVKGRPIWNSSMVPYGKIWRAGANEATIFQTDKDIKVEGKTLPAGKYSLYILVNENDWTYIFNSNVTQGLWGITRQGETTEKPETDVLRVTVKPVKSASFNERLVYNVGAKGFSLAWENLEGPVSIK